MTLTVGAAGRGFQQDVATFWLDHATCLPSRGRGLVNGDPPPVSGWKEPEEEEQVVSGQPHCRDWRRHLEGQGAGGGGAARAAASPLFQYAGHTQPLKKP